MRLVCLITARESTEHIGRPYMMYTVLHWVGRQNVTICDSNDVRYMQQLLYLMAYVENFSKDASPKCAFVANGIQIAYQQLLR